MQVFQIDGMHIDGIAACVPQNRLDNAVVLKEMYGGDTEKTIKATGIETRYIADRGTSSSDLCLACAERLLAGTGTQKEEIGGVVFVTFTPDCLMPFNAALVQERLGLEKEIPAFDLSLACSGYAYGLYMASVIAKACGRKVLLLDGDIQSAYMSRYDKSTVPVMSDAGSATLVSAGRDASWKFSFYTDGAGRSSLLIPSGGSRHPLTEEDLRYRGTENGGQRRNTDIYMDGFEIFRFVAQDVSRWLLKFMDEIHATGEALDFFVPHQANMYMIRKLAQKLKISWDNTWKSGNEVGNSASATVPVTIAKNANGLLKKDKVNTVMISGFGGGLSASAGCITLDPESYYEFFQFHGEPLSDME